MVVWLLPRRFPGYLPDLKVVVGHGCDSRHRAQPDAARAERLLLVIPAKYDLTVDLYFDVPADLQETETMSHIGGTGRQARSGGHLLESGIFAEAIGDALRLVIAAPVRVGIVRDLAAMIGLV